jgi:hypothetical protein
VAACNHLLKRQLAAAAPAANQQQKRPRGLHRLSAPCKMYKDVAEPPAPLFLLFYQVEIRLIQFLHRNSSILSQLPTRRDSTTRLWQLQGCYVATAGLPAALGMTTLYSMRAYRPLSDLTRPSLRSQSNGQAGVVSGHSSLPDQMARSRRLQPFQKWGLVPLRTFTPKFLHRDAHCLLCAAGYILDEQVGFRCIGPN